MALPPLIDLSSSDNEDELFENDVQPPRFLGKSSSPTILAQPQSYKKPPLPPISKVHAAPKRAEYHELSSSDDDNLPNGNAVFEARSSKAGPSTTRLRQDDIYGLGVASGSGTGGVRGQPPPKKLKVADEPPSRRTSKSLSVLDTLMKDPSAWEMNPRRTVSAPEPASGGFDDIEEEESVEDFSEPVHSSDLEIDVWEERQKQKQRDIKGKGREVVPPKGKEKAPPKKRGKTDEEKAAAAEEAERRKARKAVEKEEAKAAKLAAAVAKKTLQEANNLRVSKTETFKELIVDLSSSSRDSPHFSSLLPSFRNEVEARNSSIAWFDSTLDVDPSLPVGDDGLGLDHPPPPRRGYTPPTVIKLRRKITARYSEARKAWVPLKPPGTTEIVLESTVIVYLTAYELADHLVVDPATGKRNTLLELPSRVRRSLNLSPRAGVVFLVQGLNTMYKKKATMATRAYKEKIREGMGQGGRGGSKAKEGWEKELGKKEIEAQLVRLQISEKCFVNTAESDEEVIDILLSAIGDVAVRPYKLIERNHLTFAPHNNKGKTQIDTFCKMLIHMPRVTAGVAQTIQEFHGTFRGLMEAYDELEEQEGPVNRKEAEGLLSELKIGRTNAGVLSDRRLGGALSKRVCTVLREEDELLLVAST